MRTPSRSLACLLPALLLPGLLLLGAAPGCRPADEGDPAAAASDPFTYSGSYPIRVVCTTGQVADAVRNVGGERVEVTALMGAGVDPHLYKATPGDVRALAAADIVFFNGMHLEGRMADLLVRMARTRPTFAVTEGLQETADKRLREPPEFEGHYDPHLWHDVALWSECVRYVAEQLQKFDPKNADEYRQRAAAYVGVLTTLHADCRAQLAAIPEERRVLVTAHDAFGYFGQAYNVEVHGLQGISTVDEPDVAAMEELVDLLVSRGVKAVFVETSVPRRNVEALVEACGAKGHDLKIGGELFSDAMGAPDTDEATYAGMIRSNVETIAGALK